MSDAISQSLKAILSRRCANFFTVRDADATEDEAESSTKEFFGHRSDPYLENESKITITVAPNKFPIPREETAYGTNAMCAPVSDHKTTAHATLVRKSDTQMNARLVQICACVDSYRRVYIHGPVEARRRDE